MEEAIRVAKTLENLVGNSRRITMTVRSGDQCMSACALIFMLGFECNKDQCFPSRFLQPRGTVGFHAPYLNIANVNAGAELLELAYDQALSHLAFFLSQGNRLEFTTFSPRFPQNIIQNILSHGRHEFYVLETIEQVLFSGVQIIGAAERFPSKIEGIVNFCNNDTRRNNHNPFSFFPVKQINQIELGRSSSARRYQISFMAYNWAANTSYNCVLGEASSVANVGNEVVGIGMPIPMRPFQHNGNFIAETTLFDDHYSGSSLASINKDAQQHLFNLSNYIEDDFNAWMFWPGDTRIADISKP